MADTTHPPPQTPGRELGHEPETASIRGLIYFIIGLAALLAVVQVLVALLMGFYTRGEPPEAESPTVAEAPASVVPNISHWQDPRLDLARYERSQRELLSGYAWLDRERGVVRIPIERAMEALTEGVTPPPPVNAANQEAAGAPADTPSE